jgi:cytochrome b pre-mRNA-processing protein 3
MDAQKHHKTQPPKRDFMFGIFTKRQKRQEAILPFFGDVVAASRHPCFYLDCAVEDTFEGRFEMLTLMMVFTLRRLRQLPPPAGEIAQEMVDALFASLDDGLRRAGIGDIAVPKRMKKLAQGFYGRAEAYGTALDAQDEQALRIVLARNLYAGSREAADVPAGLLARLGTLADALAACDLDALMLGNTLKDTMNREEPV